MDNQKLYVIEGTIRQVSGANALPLLRCHRGSELHDRTCVDWVTQSRETAWSVLHLPPPRPILKITRLIDTETTTLIVSGRIRAEQLPDLHRFFLDCERHGIRLAHCPAYVREWICARTGLRESRRHSVVFNDQEEGMKSGAQLVSRVDGGQDDSARRAACDVEARRFNGCRGQGSHAIYVSQPQASRRLSQRPHTAWPWRRDRARNDAEGLSAPEPRYLTRACLAGEALAHVTRNTRFCHLRMRRRTPNPYAT